MKDFAKIFYEGDEVKAGDIVPGETLIFRRYNVELKEYNEQDHSFLIVASLETPDRCKDEMVMAGGRFENFLKNAVLLWAHQHCIPAVGKITELRVEGDKLIARIQFDGPEIDEFAHMLYLKYVNGTLKAFSIGFRPLKYEYKDDGGTVYSEWELYEISCCNVPMHQDALVLALKSFDVDPSVRAMLGELADSEDGFDALRKAYGVEVESPVAVISTTEKTMAALQAYGDGAEDWLSNILSLKDLVDHLTKELSEMSSIVEKSGRKFSKAAQEHMDAMDGHIAEAEKAHKIALKSYQEMMECHKEMEASMASISECHQFCRERMDALKAMAAKPDAEIEETPAEPECPEAPSEKPEKSAAPPENEKRKGDLADDEIKAIIESSLSAFRKELSGR